MLYNAFKSKKQIPPTAQKKFKEKCPRFPFDWKKIYSLPFTVTIETKIREFHYKVLNNIVFTNERLFRWGLSDSPLCTFCIYLYLLNPSNIYFPTAMLQRPSGKLSVLGSVNVKLTSNIYSNGYIFWSFQCGRGLYYSKSSNTDS